MNTEKTIQFLSKFNTELQLVEIFDYFNQENETFLFDDFLSRMDAQWIGKGVDLKCGGLGVFQGVIDGVHLEEQTITIKNVIHNGVPSKMSSVTIE